MLATRSCRESELRGHRTDIPGTSRYRGNLPFVALRPARTFIFESSCFQEKECPTTVCTSLQKAAHWQPLSKRLYSCCVLCCELTACNDCVSVQHATSVLDCISILDLSEASTVEETTGVQRNEANTPPPRARLARNAGNAAAGGLKIQTIRVSASSHRCQGSIRAVCQIPDTTACKSLS